MDIQKNNLPLHIIPHLASSLSTWIELSASAFFHNISQYKKIIGPDRKCAVVIKSNAYGHGLEYIAPLCEQHADVDWLCATRLSEATTLRALGVTKPILVMCLIDQDPQLAIAHTIDVIVYNYEQLQQLNQCGIQAGSQVRVHIKVDTGMSRFGFFPHEALAVARLIQSMPGLNLQGLYTHFAESENDNQQFTTQQMLQFHDIVTTLRSAGISIPIIHACNSAGITNQDLGLTNLVRVGGGAYGLIPSTSSYHHAQQQFASFALHAVLCWKTRIIHLRTLPAGSSVGYGRTYTTQQNTVIALLPIGYFEGYDRRLSNKGIVFLPGTQQYARVVGRVCMNVIMVEIADPTHVRVDDEVILLGDYQDIRAHDLAHVMESYNPREITTRINPTLPRFVV